jgi:Fe-S cluster assembly protein SufD
MGNKSVPVPAGKEDVPAGAILPSITDIQVEAIGRELEEPGWMIDVRRSALDQYRLLPTPSLREETWRHSDMLQFPFAELPLEVLAVSGKHKRAPSDWLRPVAGGATGGHIALEDGFPRIVTLNAEWKQAGVVFLPMSQAVKDHPGLLRELIGKVVPPSDGKFAALASVIFDAGIFLHVPKGVRLHQPLHASIWSSTPGMRAERVLVNIDEGAEAALYYECTSPERKDPAARIQIIEVSVRQDALLKLFTAQTWAKNILSLSHEKARVEKSGQLEWGFAYLGARSSKTVAGVDLLEQGASARWSGFTFLDESQQVNVSSWQNHLARETTSDFLYKGALTDSSRSHWRGMVHVAPNSMGADGYQANRILMLSDRAKSESIPGLEILADDVHCSHGVSIGEMDPEEIFYLRSRGISLHDSERLLLNGFFEPVLAKISAEDIRHRVRLALEAKMNSMQEIRPAAEPERPTEPETEDREIS